MVVDTSALLAILLGVRPVAVDADQAVLARQAFARFGRGRARAGLNLGDCFAYALARATGRPLLFEGADFAQTDVRAAAPTPPR